MVLFMFVIMLLGSERLGGGTPRYTWVSTGAVGLGTVFLIIAFVAIAQSNIGLLKPVSRAPDIRFVHGIADAPKVDVYLNAERAAEGLTFKHASPFNEVKAGTYNLLVFPACAEGVAECANPITTGAVPLLAVPLALADGEETTFVVGGTLGSPRVIAVPTNRDTLEDEGTWRMTFVHALPERGSLSLLQINRADPANPTVIVPALNYGESAPTVVLTEGTYYFEIKQGAAEIRTIESFRGTRKTHEMFIALNEIVPGISGAPLTKATVFHVEGSVKTREAFGSPQSIGRDLLTTYLLAFELIAVLLLATMVGSILLTREEVVRRVRQRLVVSPVVKRMNRSLSASAEAAKQTAPEPLETATD